MSWSGAETYVEAVTVLIPVLSQYQGTNVLKWEGESNWGTTRCKLIHHFICGHLISVGNSTQMDVYCTSTPHLPGFDLSPPRYISWFPKQQPPFAQFVRGPATSLLTSIDGAWPAPGTEQASKAKSRKESMPQFWWWGFTRKICNTLSLAFGKGFHWGPQKENLSDATCVSDKAPQKNWYFGVSGRICLYVSW